MYLKIEGNHFYFTLEGDGAVPISDADHAQFLERQASERIEWKVKNPIPDTGGLFDYIESVELPPDGEKPLTDIEQTQLALAEAIEKQETDKIEQQLAQAEMFETILQMLEPQGGGE